ncbi:hypothetical protein Klosneuvirus_6_63 [Klosneuvirus KNV1]|uniref:Uncharacterized protein n=1 Tax=Klosneuvirus KNV1 TaxID=1977640 RepID=A0A1V0SLF7_9VIRU|nr:hypothetical protein Klosneuvirus_6_63 [Klosneuvirus KNV1]
MNVVMIVSVISTVEKCLSYYPIRSVYTPEERYQQTLKTIDSIKKHIPDAYIILIEGSILNSAMEKGFKENVNIYLNYSYDQIVYNAVNDIHKSYAEGILILKFLQSDEFKNINVENLFKLSGRYYLTNSFKLDEYLNKQNCFRPIPTGVYQHDYTARYYPVLYKINKSYLEEYEHMFINHLTDTYNPNIDIEAFLCKYMKNNVKFLDLLGVAGNVSVNGVYIEQ